MKCPCCDWQTRDLCSSGLIGTYICPLDEEREAEEEERAEEEREAIEEATRLAICEECHTSQNSSNPVKFYRGAGQELPVEQYYGARTGAWLCKACAKIHQPELVE
jgi:hypothetical protein